VPDGASAVVLNFKGSGAWRDTDVSAAIGPDTAKTFVLKATAGAKPTSTVTLPLPANHNGTITLSSSRASVDIRTTFAQYLTAAASVAQKPTPAPKPTPTPTPTPALSTGTPGASNTGVPSGTSLTVHNGDLKITKAGTVIDGLDIRGVVSIQADNVTIKNSIVRGRDLTGSTPLINNLAGRANLKIIDTEVFPSKATPEMQGIYGYNFSLTRVNIHGVVDSVHLTGGNVSIEKSWLHDNLHFENDPYQGGTPSHDDSVQIQAGSGIRIDGNNISGAFNTGIQITQDRGTVSNVSITNNVADGGGCTVNVAEKGKGAIQGLSITDNEFGRHTKVDDCAVIAPSTTKISMARNVYIPDNEPVVIHKG